MKIPVYILDTSLKAALVPEMETVPGEYVDKLLKTMAKHPQYHGLVMDLIGILKRHEKM